MLIIKNVENESNQELIRFIQKHTMEEIIMIKTSQELEKIFESKKLLPSIGIFFIHDLDAAEKELNDFHAFFDSHHVMIYCIAVAESSLKTSQNQLAGSFEFVFIHPLVPETLLKEIKKGTALIQNINNKINADTSFTNEVSEIVSGNNTQKYKYLFDPEIIGIHKILSQLKESPSQSIQERLYQKLKPNFAWKGKTVIKNYEGNGLSFNDEHFYYDKTTLELRAKSLGFVELKYSFLELVPAAEISPDGMNAFGFIFPVDENRERDGMSLYFEGIQSLNVLKGIFYDQINDNYKKAFHDKIIFYQKIAEGKTPEDGYASFVELLIQKKDSAGKIIDNLGTINYREHSKIINVKKDEIIARKISEKPAEEGFTVSGKDLPAKFEEKKTWDIGENIFFDEQKKEYKAQADGMVVFEQNTIHVRETLLIPGNVDIKTGNIHSNKNIIIQGNVEADMYVEAKGNIIIKGTVEDAKIVAGGSIEAHGFLGSGKTWVFGKGDITADFIQNSHVEALGNISFKKFIVNSEIYTTQKIIGNDKSKVFGGKLEAAKGAVFYDIGNEQEIHTSIILGANFYNERIISKILDRVNVLKKEKEQIISVLKDYLNLSQPIEPQLKKFLKNDRVNLIKKITQLKEKHLMITKLENSLKQITKEVKDEFSSKMKVLNKLHPGVDINIVSAVKKINQDYQRVELYFSAEKAEIVIVNLF